MIGRIASLYLRKTPSFPGKIRLLGVLLLGRREVRVKSVYGPWLIGDVRDATFRSAIAGRYDDVYAEVRSLRAGDAFVDVGANAGVFSLAASRLVGPTGVVVSVEPSRLTFSRLIRNLEVNACRNVHPFRFAVLSRSSMVSFAAGDAVHSGVAHVDPKGEEMVPAFGAEVLRPIIETIVGSRRTTVKIDVEGAECMVISALKDVISWPNVVRVIVEIDNDLLARFGSKPSDLYHAMASLGFVWTIGCVSAHYNEVFVKPDHC